MTPSKIRDLIQLANLEATASQSRLGQLQLKATGLRREIAKAFDIDPIADNEHSAGFHAVLERAAIQRMDLLQHRLAALEPQIRAAKQEARRAIGRERVLNVLQENLAKAARQKARRQMS